jgi:hypothetical protein
VELIAEDLAGGYVLREMHPAYHAVLRHLVGAREELGAALRHDIAEHVSEHA